MDSHRKMLLKINIKSNMLVLNNNLLLYTIQTEPKIFNLVPPPCSNLTSVNLPGWRVAGRRRCAAARGRGRRAARSRRAPSRAAGRPSPPAPATPPPRGARASPPPAARPSTCSPAADLPVANEDKISPLTRERIGWCFVHITYTLFTLFRISTRLFIIIIISLL